MDCTGLNVGQYLIGVVCCEVAVMLEGGCVIQERAVHDCSAT